MTTIIPFDVAGTQIRFGTTSDGTPYAVAADYAKIMGYTRTSDALKLLDEDEKGTAICRTPGGPQEMKVIYEDGLWELIFRSSLPGAKAIKSRVKAILREIRETGRYEALPSLDDPLAALEHQTGLTRQAIELAKTERARAQAAEQRAAALEPDAARARRTLDTDGLALVGTVAKRFGIREKTLRGFLYEEQLLMRTGSRRNEPYARWVASGHFEVKTRIVGDDPDRPPVARSTTYVTPKGEDLIWSRLHRAGLVAAPTPPTRQLELA